MIQHLDSGQADFAERLEALRVTQSDNLAQVDAAVAGIIEHVAGRGDAAVLELTRRFDSNEATSLAELRVTGERFEAAANSIEPLVLEARTESVARVRAYHERQRAQLGAERW